MPRKKKRATAHSPRSPRKTPYTRALETAQKRLERANIELAKYGEKLKGLSIEIPHLESVIAVLSGRRQEHKKDVPYIPPPVVNKDLAQYLSPSLDGVGSIPAVHDPEDDKFLPDV
jgi:hypothetical protein